MLLKLGNAIPREPDINSPEIKKRWYKSILSSEITDECEKNDHSDMKRQEFMVEIARRDRRVINLNRSGTSRREEVKGVHDRSNVRIRDGVHGPLILIYLLFVIESHAA